MKKVFVVGGGPAGMMAALAAAMMGKEVSIFERNNILGKKLLVTGNGRCNITNFTDKEKFFENIPGNSKFLYSAFSKFSNKDLIEFLNKNGLKTKIERGLRVFPVSDKSIEVRDFFVNMLRKYGVKVNYNCRVNDIIVKNKQVKGISVGESVLNCDSIVLATGGVSYPTTGSTGDGYKIAKKLGHTIVEPFPSLVPIVTYENVRELMGLTLKNVKVSVFFGKKLIREELGEMLFTHFGLSGPVILILSRFLHDYLGKGEVVIKIDLKPELTIEKLEERVLRDFNKYQNRNLKNALEDLLPHSLILYVIKRANIHPDKKVREITRSERKSLVTNLKNLTFKVKDLRPIREAIVTGGGVSIKEINPSTMESKIIKGLFFAGEIIDVDGLTGGFNLQIAFSTGYVAGINA
ncbi:NAD(P)/FAD-dependent oxidoreductase [Thermoanaerobacter mathranii]|uniref:NAD(P)/FAD-dependent oxidoreductase n=1 Tax=Thermoanaerobacter mathranii TaxID=583357 RepID=UPI003D6A845C